MGDFVSDEGTIDVASTASGLSVLLWGLVVAKSKQGLAASQTKESSSVANKIQKVGYLLVLIAGATVCKFVSEGGFSDIQSMSKAKDTTGRKSL